MNILFRSIIIVCFLTGCKTFEMPRSIPTGTWHYKLFLNGSEMGNAAVTSAATAEHYISTIEMSINAGSVQSTTKEIVTETKSFVPVKFESYNRVITNDGHVQNMDTFAMFNGKEITVTSHGQTANIIIDQPFVLAGEYFTKAMLDKGYKENSSVEADIYNPLLETEDVVSVKQVVIGVESVDINGKKEDLLHIKEIMADFQESDIYIDSSGVARKIRALMLNNLIELVIEK